MDRFEGLRKRWSGRRRTGTTVSDWCIQTRVEDEESCQGGVRCKSAIQVTLLCAPQNPNYWINERRETLTTLPSAASFSASLHLEAYKSQTHKKSLKVTAAPFSSFKMLTVGYPCPLMCCIIGFKAVSQEMAPPLVQISEHFTIDLNELHQCFPQNVCFPLKG